MVNSFQVERNNLEWNRAVWTLSKATALLRSAEEKKNQQAVT